MKKLILVAGLPGVGKSTLARTIAQKNNGLVLDLDDFKKITVDPKLVTTQIDPPEIRWIYYSQAINHALTLQIDVVVMDEVFHLHSLRSQIENLCFNNGIEVEWIEVVCSYGVVEKRLNAKKRERHILSKDEALRMYLLFQEIFEKFPEGKENYIVVNNND